jgi:LysM repeat protein
MKYLRHNDKLNNPFSKRLAVWVITLTIAIFLPIFSSSKTAHASLFSFIASLFESQSVSAKLKEASSSNSQTITLLAAAVNSDPNPNKSAETMPIGNGDVLIPEIVMAEDTSQDAPINTQISVYKVQSGDTVSSVAKMFNVSINTVLWSNNLTSRSILRTGDTLVILPISGVTHTVKKGDTIDSIVKKYKADLEEVLSYNDITLSSKLSIGQEIIIPYGDQVVSVSSKVVTGSNPAHGISGPSYPGYYVRPIDGGRRSQGLHGYNGIDLAAPVGTPIHAAAAGTVIVARSGGWNGGYGSFVIVSHNNGTQTLYAHASKILVSVGQYVAQGDTIALLGNTGLSTGPHVHFEIRGAKNPF